MPKVHLQQESHMLFVLCWSKANRAEGGFFGARQELPEQNLEKQEQNEGPAWKK